MKKPKRLSLARLPPTLADIILHTKLCTFPFPFCIHNLNSHFGMATLRCQPPMLSPSRSNAPRLFCGCLFPWQMPPAAVFVKLCVLLVSTVGFVLCDLRIKSFSNAPPRPLVPPTPLLHLSSPRRGFAPFRLQLPLAFCFVFLRFLRLLFSLVSRQREIRQSKPPPKAPYPPTQPPTNTSHCQPHFTIFWLSLLLLPSLFWTFRLLPSPLVFGPRPAFLFFFSPPVFCVCCQRRSRRLSLPPNHSLQSPPFFRGDRGVWERFFLFFFCSALFRLYFLTGENVWPSLKYDTITRSWGL